MPGVTRLWPRVSGCHAPGRRASGCAARLGASRAWVRLAWSRHSSEVADSGLAREKKRKERMKKKEEGEEMRRKGERKRRGRKEGREGRGNGSFSGFVGF